MTGADGVTTGLGSLGDASFDRGIRTRSGTAQRGWLVDDLSVNRAERTYQDLLTLWQAQYGALGELNDDLESTRRWFDPVAQGDRLRRAIAGLPPAPPLGQRLSEPLVVCVDEQRFLITPEGRCALEILARSLKVASTSADDASARLPTVDASDIERALLETYRRWVRHRLDGVLRLLNGDDKPLQISAAGLVLALLVNRSTSPERAMVRYRSGVRRQQVDDAFFSPVAAFTRRLSPKTRADPAKWRLISGWNSGEARRRLGTAFVLEREKTDQDGYIYVREGQINDVLDVIVRDLRRGHRAAVDSTLFREAWRDLVAAFRSSVPALAGYGLVHERPTDTERLGRTLIERFQAFER